MGKPTQEELTANVDDLVKTLGPARWYVNTGTVDEQVELFRKMLEDSVKDPEKPFGLHWLSTTKDNKSICLIGNTPSSPRIGRALEGLWNGYLQEILE